MPAVCLYFQIHQPFRLRKYTVFDTDTHYFDDGMNTAEIIHYDVQPGEPCSRVGGLVRTELVPGPASAVETPFCVPKVLVDRNIPFDR